MNNFKCLKCLSENVYQDQSLWICAECFHEMTESELSENQNIPEIPTIDTSIVKDSNGQILTNGDSVVVIKDLKIKGASSVIKGGTKVRNIKLYDAGDGHNISCKIDGLGSIQLKSEFVKKS